MEDTLAVARYKGVALNKFALTPPPNIVGALAPTVPTILKLATSTFWRIKKPRLSGQPEPPSDKRLSTKILHESRFKAMLEA